MCECTYKPEKTWTGEEAAKHADHRIELVVYVDGESVTIECIDCGMVLVAFEDLESQVVCHKHPEQELICPKCRGSRGGSTTAKRYSKEQQIAWGKRGGRPKKTNNPSQIEITTS